VSKIYTRPVRPLKKSSPGGVCPWCDAGVPFGALKAPHRDGKCMEASGEAAKSAAKPGMSRAEYDRYLAITRLEKQAADWRQKALDGRVNGLDRQVRELYVSKAEKAEAEAERLKNGERLSAEAQAKADLHEAQAKQFDRKALDAGSSGLASYYRDRARECRTLAALARGERPEVDGGGRSVSFTA